MQTVRDFIAFHEIGILSSHSSSVNGYPFGSIVPYDLDPQGRIILFVSLISEHFRNLEKNPKGCLFVADSHGLHDPQPFARASVLGEFSAIPNDELDEVKSSYWQRFPESPSRSIAHNFVFLRALPERIRWIGGFGDIRWVSGNSYKNTEFDPIAYAGRSIARHMNEDHRDAMAELLRFHHDLTVPPQSCILAGISKTGCLIQIDESHDKKKRLEIPFRRPLQKVDEVRGELIAQLKECRASEENS